MLVLYYRPYCPYCLRVLAASVPLNLHFEKKNIGDPTIAAELIARGGKQQVPYLVDTERGVELYESADIICYLKEHYSAPTES